MGNLSIDDSIGSVLEALPSDCPLWFIDCGALAFVHWQCSKCESLVSFSIYRIWCTSAYCLGKTVEVSFKLVTNKPEYDSSNQAWLQFGFKTQLVPDIGPHFRQTVRFSSIFCFSESWPEYENTLHVVSHSQWRGIHKPCQTISRSSGTNVAFSTKYEQWCSFVMVFQLGFFAGSY